MTADLLSRIVASKRREISALPAQAVSRAHGASFIDALKSSGPAIIAEIKPVSPVKGRLIELAAIPTMVATYDAHAQAISVLCDQPFFGGGFELLKHVSSLTKKPLLCKEFILDERQLDLAAANGASAALLIAGILDTQSLGELLQAALIRNLDVLIEIHDRPELDRVIGLLNHFTPDELKRIAVGVNNRNLKTTVIDISVSRALAPVVRSLLPGIGAVVTESGISTVQDVRLLKPSVDAFLIGSSLLSAPDPGALIDSFRAS